MVTNRGMDVAMSASMDVVMADDGVGAFYEVMERESGRFLLVFCTCMPVPAEGVRARSFRVVMDCPVDVFRAWS
jgi:hypothetical protein